MSPAKKRILFAVIVTILVLTACTSASVATKDPELVQIEQTVDALLAAQNEPPVEGQATGAASTPTPVALQEAVDPVSGVQNLQATETPMPTLDFLQETIVAMFTAQHVQSTSLAAQAEQATETAQQIATESASSLTAESEEEEFPFFATATQEPFPECKITILGKSSSAKTFRLPVRQPLLDLKKGNKIIILRPVNLRSGPTLTHRIILTLRPDPSTVPYETFDPNPTPTLIPRPEILYTIIGGPAYTTIGDETGDNISFTVSGRKYKWWQIELPNKTIGWIVEASACGQIQFIAKAEIPAQ
jgi:hypothetical protein